MPLSTSEGNTPLEMGERVGRYEIERKLGEGGMGVVYAAYDPQLDRRIALKLLRRETSERAGESLADGQARLLREAQAMARLAHTNVVAVFDVGTHEGHRYVAMEYVDGMTLRRWLAGGGLGQREIVSAFIAAGRGLVAAHDVGLVHRDFKPDNVLRSNAGRICVVDFGLVHSTTAPELAAPGAPPPDTLGVRMTQSGTVLGTPAYMAPEQIDGTHVDARTDQFSFCVALYEALYGELPFAGSTFEELAHELLHGKVRPAPPRSRVPDKLRQVLLRGLAREPGDRFSSMDELLARLVPPSRTRRSLWIAASLGVVLVGATVVYQAKRPALLCRASARRLDGIWTPSTRAATHDAIAATKLPYAEHTWERVSGALDAYTSAWIAARTEACEATHVRGEQSEQLLDLRMACLDARLQEVRALSSLFTHADGDAVEHAESSLGTLHPLGRCADAKALTARVPLPDDAATRRELDAIGGQLADAGALIAAGKAKDALDRVGPLIEKAQRLHYAPLIAEALGMKGGVELTLGNFADATKTLKQALLVAEATGDDDSTAALWNQVMRAYVEQDKLPEAADALAHGDAFAQRLPDPTPSRAALDYTTGIMEMHAGKYAQAREPFLRALDAWTKHDGPVSRDVSRALGALSTRAFAASDGAEAIGYAKRALDVDRKLLGADHPDLILDEQTLGNAYESVSRDDEAAAAYRTSLDIAQRTLPPDHPILAQAWGSWAVSLGNQHRTAESLAALQHALSIQEKNEGPESAIYAQTLSNIGLSEIELGKLDDAQRHLSLALAIKEKALGPEHDEVGRTVSLLAQVAGERHRYDEAKTLIERALAIFHKTLGPTSMDLAEAEETLAEAEAALGQPRAAIAAFERALTVRDAEPERKAAPETAYTRLSLARLLWTNGDRARALTEARAARATLVRDDPRHRLPEADKLLRSNHG